MNARTPGPWAWAQYADGLTLVGAPRDGSSVRRPIDFACGSADTAFIVTACNAHDDLVAALQLYFANDSRFHKAASDALAKAGA